MERRRTAWTQAGYPMSIKRMGDALAAPVFPPPPLKFRTAGFPQYGFKQEFDHDLREPKFLIHGQKPCSSSPANDPEGQGPEGLEAMHPKAILSRGPWLANRLCCPVGSKLTMALIRATRHLATGLFASSSGHEGSEWVPNLSSVSVCACHPQDPGGPIGCFRLFLPRPLWSSSSPHGLDIPRAPRTLVPTWVV